ncbi:MAG TPA: DUF3619 family protein [Rhodocyclaceae bacterium]|nr:DUF3619 family protein [Rhodocyclaceae bacterium]
MTEERFASRIRQALNHSLDDVPPTALRRLEAARHHALSRQKQAETAPVLASEFANLGNHRLFNSPAHQRLRTLLAISALILGMAIAAYWQADDYIASIVDVDSALLADELPPEAFLDKGFSTWLLNDSSEE